jgi:ABC-type sugar transport system ATPase subunit
MKNYLNNSILLSYYIKQWPAIVRKPEVFLFDEPLSNLDEKLRVSMCL